MTKLSVNVNKIALLRNSRGKNHPDVLQMSQDILAWGAHGITVHPRPDGRHIRPTDLPVLADLVRAENQHRTEGQQVEFNVEGYPSSEYLESLKTLAVHQATLVPDPPEALTSNAGWQLQQNQEFLTHVVGELRSQGVRVSLFLDPFQLDDSEMESLLTIRPDRVELYTEAFADAFGTDQQNTVVARYQKVAVQLFDLGIGINAGHDLNQRNLPFLLREIPMIEEVSIGHAIVCEALYTGFRSVVESYLRIVSREI